MTDTQKATLLTARAALKKRFTEDCARELERCSKRINEARAALGLHAYTVADLSNSGLEPAWFDAGDSPSCRALRAALTNELQLAHRLYGFPHHLANPERHDDFLWRSGSAHKLTPDQKADLRARLEFGEEIRDHVKQVVDYEHKKHPDLVPFSAEALEEALVLAPYLRACAAESRHGAPLLRRLMRPTTDADALHQQFKDELHHIHAIFDRHLFTGEFQELDDILRKGLLALAAHDDFRPFLAPYLGAE